MADRKGGKRETGRGSEREGERERERERGAGQEDASVADGSAQLISNLPPGRMMGSLALSLSLVHIYSLCLLQSSSFKSPESS